MDERLRFVARLLEGEKMAPLCAEFGISRKTGYKIFDRYKDCGVQAFSDRSHRAHRQANRLPGVTPPLFALPVHTTALVECFCDARRSASFKIQRKAHTDYLITPLELAAQLY